MSVFKAAVQILVVLLGDIRRPSFVLGQADQSVDGLPARVPSTSLPPLSGSAIRSSRKMAL